MITTVWLFVDDKVLRGVFDKMKEEHIQRVRDLVLSQQVGDH